jgi:hypothetical protein
MELLSSQLVGEAYRQRLREDLERASVCRFLVAYVSSSGIRAVGIPPLVRALQDPRSFGIASLSCICGYEALLDLQASLREPRLKYFLDPLVPPEESDEIVLFHSKLVYIALEGDENAVIYLGSHNWTGRALGPGRPRNAEASVRVEVPVLPGDLEGTGDTLASDVNRHLLQAYHLPACLPATEQHRRTFEQWYQAGCKNAPSTRGGDVIVILAVHRTTGTPVDAAQWQRLAGAGVYLQVFGSDGERIWNSGLPLVVLVWNSPEALKAADQPLMLWCRLSANNAGPDSTIHGTNQSAAPMAGFNAVIFSPDDLAARAASRVGRPTTITIWSGHEVEVFEIEFPTGHQNSSQVDAGLPPTFQFYLEVEQVVFPAEGARPQTPDYLWSRDTFAVATNRKEVRFVGVPGYLVPPKQAEEIRRCLQEVLGVGPGELIVGPLSGDDRPKSGKRTAVHPLHDTFIGPSIRERKEEFYRGAAQGSFLADLDPTTARHQSGGVLFYRQPEPLRRVQRVFTSRRNDLLATWWEAARRTRDAEGR